MGHGGRRDLFNDDLAGVVLGVIKICECSAYVSTDTLLFLS